MASSLKIVSGRSLKKIINYVIQFFKQYKLDINITAVTSEATGVSERLKNTILKEGKGFLGKEELCFSKV